MSLKKIHIVLLLLIVSNCFSGNPAIHGNWKGFLISKTPEEDNKDGLPVTLYIIDDNDQGDLVGEMTVQYRYQTDVYKAKWSISGNIDYYNYTITLQQDNFVYYDLLPKGLQWCAGYAKLNIYRSTYIKKLYMDGSMYTNCGEEKLRLILVKE
ncbi:MAG: hypothetical protein U0T77_06520 [Chitinophagales bacterium]